MINRIKNMIKQSRLLYVICIEVYGFVRKIACEIFRFGCGHLEDKVVFVSFKGSSYSDNPRAISERLHFVCPEVEIVWLFKDVDKKKKVVPEYVRCVEYGSLESKKELYTAKFWVDNAAKPFYEIKSKKQIYIQTWHGDKPIKKVGFDKKITHNKPQKMFESKNCDLFLCGSEFGEKMIRSAFQYGGEILNEGNPRNDILCHITEKGKCKLKEKIGIDRKTKIILYAPTFREKARNNQQECAILDLRGIIDCLEQMEGSRWKVLTRAHPSAGKGLDVVAKGKIINVSAYEDMADLLAISDLLITDYSSCAADFIIQNRPAILFCPSYETYINEDRTLYYGIEELPYWICQSMEDVYEILTHMTHDKIIENCNQIIDFYGIHENGEAAKSVVNYMEQYISKTKGN